MKKKILTMALCAAMCAPTLAGLTACGGGMKITVWCSDTTGVKELTIKQIERFNEAHPDMKVNATVEAVSEQKSAGDMIKSVSAGADLYFFAQDQFSRLVEVSALARPGKDFATAIKKDNIDFAVSAASLSNGTVYAYPLTSDNTFFMYYDKDVIDETKIGDLDELLAECVAKNTKISFPFGSGKSWYNAAFFFGTGCKSNWTLDADGAFSAVDDDFNSDAGVEAVKGMQKILTSTAYNDNYGGAKDFSLGDNTKSSVVIGGTWDYQVAKAAVKNLGVAQLPKWKGSDGETEYTLKPFYACKLIGVKPQEGDAERVKALSNLAQYLSGEECQKERFDQFKWRPTVKSLLEKDEVKNDEFVKIVSKNIEIGVQQGQIPEKWWGYADNISITIADSSNTKTIETILADYETNIKSILKTA